MSWVRLTKMARLWPGSYGDQPLRYPYCRREPAARRAALVLPNDGLSTTVVTDAAANVVERYDYGDYGRPQFYDAAWQPRAASALGNHWLAGSRADDPETRLIHDRGRYFDPRAGRFITR